MMSLRLPCATVTRALVVLAACLLASTGLCWAAPPSSAVTTSLPDPFVVWMQALHDDWALPGYGRLQQHSWHLAQQLEDACAEARFDDASLPRLRSTWRDTLATWRALEVMQLGPTLKRRSSKAIDFWPTRPRSIHQAMSFTHELPLSGPAAREGMAIWGAAAKGLPALEWLLFSDSIEPAPIALDPQHCRYSTRIAFLVADEAQELLTGWRVEAARWHAEPPPDTQDARHLVLNLLAGDVELLRVKRLLKAAFVHASHQNITRDRLDAFDSMRSGNHRSFMLIYVDAMTHLLLGKNPGNGLAALPEFAALRPRLQTSLDAARQAIAALPDDAHAWSPQTVTPAAKALGPLRDILARQMAQAWQVQIQFTDADGD